MHTSCGWSFAPLLAAYLVSPYNLLVLTQTQKCMLVKTLKHNDLEKLRIIFLPGGWGLFVHVSQLENKRKGQKQMKLFYKTCFFVFILCGIP